MILRATLLPVLVIVTSTPSATAASPRDVSWPYSRAAPSPHLHLQNTEEKDTQHVQVSSVAKGDSGDNSSLASNQSNSSEADVLSGASLRRAKALAQEEKADENEPENEESDQEEESIRAKEMKDDEKEEFSSATQKNDENDQHNNDNEHKNDKRRMEKNDNNEDVHENDEENKSAIIKEANETNIVKKQTTNMLATAAKTEETAPSVHSFFSIPRQKQASKPQQHRVTTSGSVQGEKNTQAGTEYGAEDATVSESEEESIDQEYGSESSSSEEKSIAFIVLNEGNRYHRKYSPEDRLLFIPAVGNANSPVQSLRSLSSKFSASNTPLDFQRTKLGGVIEGAVANLDNNESRHFIESLRKLTSQTLQAVEESEEMDDVQIENSERTSSELENNTENAGNNQPKKASLNLKVADANLLDHFKIPEVKPQGPSSMRMKENTEAVSRATLPSNDEAESFKQEESPTGVKRKDEAEIRGKFEIDIQNKELFDTHEKLESTFVDKSEGRELHQKPMIITATPIYSLEDAMNTNRHDGLTSEEIVKLSKKYETFLNNFRSKNANIVGKVKNKDISNELRSPIAILQSMKLNASNVENLLEKASKISSASNESLHVSDRATSMQTSHGQVPMPVAVDLDQFFFEFMPHFHNRETMDRGRIMPMPEIVVNRNLKGIQSSQRLHPFEEILLNMETGIATSENVSTTPEINQESIQINDSQSSNSILKEANDGSVAKRITFDSIEDNDMLEADKFIDEKAAVNAVKTERLRNQPLPSHHNSDDQHRLTKPVNANGGTTLLDDNQQPEDTINSTAQNSAFKAEMVEGGLNTDRRISLRKQIESLRKRVRDEFQSSLPTSKKERQQVFSDQRAAMQKAFKERLQDMLTKHAKMLQTQITEPVKTENSSIVENDSKFVENDSSIFVHQHMVKQPVIRELVHSELVNKTLASGNSTMDLTNEKAAELDNNRSAHANQLNEGHIATEPLARQIEGQRQIPSFSHNEKSEPIPSVSSKGPSETKLTLSKNGESQIQQLIRERFNARFRQMLQALRNQTNNVNNSTPFSENKTIVSPVESKVEAQRSFSSFVANGTESSQDNADNFAAFDGDLESSTPKSEADLSSPIENHVDRTHLELKSTDDWEISTDVQTEQSFNANKTNSLNVTAEQPNTHVAPKHNTGKHASTGDKLHPTMQLRDILQRRFTEHLRQMIANQSEQMNQSLPSSNENATIPSESVRVNAKDQLHQESVPKKETEIRQHIQEEFTNSLRRLIKNQTHFIEQRLVNMPKVSTTSTKAHLKEGDDSTPSLVLSNATEGKVIMQHGAVSDNSKAIKSDTVFKQTVDPEIKKKLRVFTSDLVAGQNLEASSLTTLPIFDLPNHQIEKLPNFSQKQISTSLQLPTADANLGNTALQILSSARAKSVSVAGHNAGNKQQTVKHVPSAVQNGNQKLNNVQITRIPSPQPQTRIRTQTVGNLNLSFVNAKKPAMETTTMATTATTTATTTTSQLPSLKAGKIDPEIKKHMIVSTGDLVAGRNSQSSFLKTLPIFDLPNRQIEKLPNFSQKQISTSLQLPTADANLGNTALQILSSARGKSVSVVGHNAGNKQQTVKHVSNVVQNGSQKLDNVQITRTKSLQPQTRIRTPTVGNLQRPITGTQTTAATSTTTTTSHLPTHQPGKMDLEHTSKIESAGTSLPAITKARQYSHFRITKSFPTLINSTLETQKTFSVRPENTNLVTASIFSESRKNKTILQDLQPFDEIEVNVDNVRTGIDPFTVAQDIRQFNLEISSDSPSSLLEAGPAQENEQRNAKDLLSQSYPSIRVKSPSGKTYFVPKTFLAELYESWEHNPFGQPTLRINEAVQLLQNLRKQ